MKFSQLPKRDIIKYKRLCQDKQQQAMLHYMVNNYDILRHEWAVGEQLITLEGIMQLMNNCNSLRVFWDTLILQLEEEREINYYGIKNVRECKVVAYAVGDNGYWDLKSSITNMGIPDTAKQLLKDLNGYYLNAIRGNKHA